MKRSIRTGLICLTVSLCAVTASYAETISGKVLLLDPGADRMVISPSGGKTDKEQAVISVSEFLASKKAAELDTLEVGHSVSLDVKRDPVGKLSLVSIHKRKEPASAADPRLKYLLTKGQEKAPGRQSAAKRFEFKPVRNRL